MINEIITELQKTKDIFKLIKEAIISKGVSSSGNPSKFSTEIELIQSNDNPFTITRTVPESRIEIYKLPQSWRDTKQLIYEEGPQNTELVSEI